MEPTLKHIFNSLRPYSFPFPFDPRAFMAGKWEATLSLLVALPVFEQLDIHNNCSLVFPEKLFDVIC